jgi:hypothetical protein
VDSTGSAEPKSEVIGAVVCSASDAALAMEDPTKVEVAMVAAQRKPATQRRDLGGVAVSKDRIFAWDGFESVRIWNSEFS